jgi:hypothetical protein
MKRLILILGMGRSGTSLVSNAIGKLGFDLGQNLIPANASNKEGYFEDRDIVETHKILLRELGCGELSLIPPPSDWLSLAPVQSAKARITELLAGRLSSTDKVAVKDPRISLLLPMWYEIAEALGAELGLIFCVRSPAAVAASLNAASNTEKVVGESVWLCRAMAAAESWKGGFVIHYEDIMQDASATMASLARWVGAEEKLPEIENLVKSDLNHQSHELPIENEFVNEVHKSLERGESAELISEKFALLERYHSSLRVLDGLIARMRDLASPAGEPLTDTHLAIRLSRLTRVVAVAEDNIVEAVRNRSVRMLREFEQVQEGIKAERRSINELVRQRAQQLLAAEQGVWEARLREIEEKNALQLAAEQEAARLPRQVFEELTEQNRLQEIKIREFANQIDSMKAWRSANEVREEQIARLVAELNDAKKALDRFGEGGDSAVVPMSVLKNLTESARSAPVIALDRANPLALLLRGIRAARAGRSKIRRRFLHLHYLLRLRRPGRARDVMAMATSGFFDASYYVNRHPEAKAGNTDPLLHYIDVGAGKGLDPSVTFSTRYYLQSNPTVANANINPLLHFLRRGRTSGSQPSAMLVLGGTLGNLFPSKSAANETAGKSTKKKAAPKQSAMPGVKAD